MMKWNPKIMIPRTAQRLFAVSLLVLCFTSGVSAQDLPPLPDGSQYVWTEIANGFDNPLFMTNARDGSNRLFVGEQTGYILVVENGEILFDPFLDVSNLLSDDVFQGGYSERGLLGLAFHPDYANNGLFYVSHTDLAGNNVIAQYNVSADDPNLATPDSRVTIMTIAQPHYDHNGGNIAFGNDGYLYIGIGDGGSLGDDPGASAQNLTLHLGKLLRIDINIRDSDHAYTIPSDNPFINTPDAQPEIWAYGLRNPWRFTFDRLTGDLFLGDVGQADYEEIDFQAAGTPGGQNYGWYWMEGMHPRPNFEVPEADFVAPIAEYPHMIGCSVTGGYVYRGMALPELNGVYFFGDYCNGRTWAIVPDVAGAWQTRPFIETERIISSFGEDEDGELYIVDYKGAVLRLESAP